MSGETAGCAISSPSALRWAAITKYPGIQRIRGDFSGFHISPDTFYMALGRCGVLVSRFSSCILEALITAKPAVYYNPGFEKARKFQEPMGAYLAPTDKKQLASALREVLDGRRFPTFDFLERHCSVSATSGQRAAAAIRSALNGGRPPVGASPAMLDGIRRICAQAEHSH
ncbi:MAG: hypothetical protein IPL11_03820 [Candidatus Accumulibacter sp.]|nr:hypothetical protein [Accumulibacter sp.]